MATNVVGIMLVMTGIVWSLQGADLLGGSFMTGQRRWTIIGIACLIVGLAMLVRANRRRRA